MRDRLTSVIMRLANKTRVATYVQKASLSSLGVRGRERETAHNYCFIFPAFCAPRFLEKISLSFAVRPSVRPACCCLSAGRSGGDGDGGRGDGVVEVQLLVSDKDIKETKAFSLT